MVTSINEAEEVLHLKRNDVLLAEIIDRVGNFKIRPRLPS